MRHASVMYYKRYKYFEFNRFTQEQKKRLSLTIDVWVNDLDLQIEALTKTMTETRDAAEKKRLLNLLGAIDLVRFNSQHDRGMVVAPSTWLQPKADEIPYLLHFMLRLSKSESAWTNNRKNIGKAYQYLREFWMDPIRVAQERDILSESLREDELEAYDNRMRQFYRP